MMIMDAQNFNFGNILLLNSTKVGDF